MDSSGTLRHTAGALKVTAADVPGHVNVRSMPGADSTHLLRVIPFRAESAARWDSFVATSWNGTLLHSRRYLEYHLDRYQDESILIEDTDGKLLGVLPAAHDPQSPGRLISHPGITYGGLVQAGGLKGERQVHALAAAFCHYRDRGFKELIYKATPHIYQRVPSEDDQFALVRLGAQLDRIDLAAVVDLDGRPPLPKGRRHALRKAQKRSIRAVEDAFRVPELWQIVRENLRTRHCTSPTHSEAEITDLIRRFPDQIRCVVGLLNEEVVGGVILFEAGPVLVTQYMASTPVGRANAVLDLLLGSCLQRAHAEAKRYLSLGTSSIADGYLNEGLHHFKGLFGAGGVAHQLFRIDLYRPMNVCPFSGR